MNNIEVSDELDKIVKESIEEKKDIEDATEESLVEDAAVEPKDIEVSPHLDAIVKEEVQNRSDLADSTEKDLKSDKFDKADFEETAATATLAVEASRKYKQYEQEITGLQDELKELKLKHEEEVSALKEELSAVKNERETYKARLEESGRQNQRTNVDRPESRGDDSEVSLSPPLPQSKYRPRVGSLVDVDLFDVSNARQAIGKWAGWQVDLRQWRSQGIGSVVTL